MPPWIEYFAVAVCAITAVLAAHPRLDAQTVNQLVRQARKEQEEDFAPAASRNLSVRPEQTE